MLDREQTVADPDQEDRVPLQALGGVQRGQRDPLDRRRVLLGGPPVLVAYRDVDAEVEAWRDRARERREARLREAEEERRREAEALAAMSWRERRRARRLRRGR